METTWTLLRHDIAAPHKHKDTATIQYLEGEKIQVLTHPPYSPALAPCDLGLFSTLKTGLAGKSFLRIQDLAKSGEFTTSCRTLFGIPQRLPKTAMATATLCGQQRRVFGKLLKIALL